MQQHCTHIYINERDKMALLVITATAALTTALGAIGTFLAGQKWIFPYIKDFFNRKNKKAIDSIDVESKLLNIDKENSNLYSGQITFFVGQIDNMQKLMLKRAEEINEMSIQCDGLRTELLLLKKQLFTLKTKNSELKEFYCVNRIKHKN